MKNLIKITLALLGMLNVPSVVFADEAEEAMTEEETVAWYDSGVVWYGSLRAGLMSSDSNLSVFDGGSRWGIRGSHEAGEGLIAVYQFEHNMFPPDAVQPGIRLSYVGLSGGFGRVTLGKIWSASFTSVGTITENSWFWGNSQTTHRHGSAISYAFANALMRLQIDAVYADLHPNPALFNVYVRDDPKEDLERTEFGLSVNIGRLGRVAIAHLDDRYSLIDNGTGDINLGGTITRTKMTTLAAEVSVSDLKAYIGTQNTKRICLLEFVGPPLPESFNPCSRITKAKTTFFGFRGGLGDTGLRYVFQWRDVKSRNRKPWLLSLTKSLGNRTSLVFEHADYDGGRANQTGVALAVEF